MNETKINLSLSEPDVNQILFALGKLPFEDVVSVIMTIKRQGDEQVRARQAEAAKAEAAKNAQDKLDSEEKSD